MNVFSESVIVLDCPYLAAAIHADIQNFHDHKQVASQTRKFGAYDEIAFARFAEKAAERALAVVLCSADCFFDPSIYAQLLATTEFIDFKTLVFNCLLVAADSDVAVCHDDR